MKKYIDLSTQRRAQAKNDFEKDFYKFMNNSVYGKSFENVRNRAKVKLENGHEQNDLERLIAKPNFKDAFVFDDSNLVCKNGKRVRFT